MEKTVIQFKELSGDRCGSELGLLDDEADLRIASAEVIGMHKGYT